MNNKGLTVVELIVSFALTMIVAVFLFRTILTLKDSYVGSGVKSQLLNKQTLMSSKINNDFYEKGVKIALRCGKDCLNFIFNDNTSSKLIVDRDNNLFSYGNYNTKLVDGSKYGAVDIHTETTLNVESGKKDSFIIVKIPVTHPLLKEDYGVNIIYQYDSRTSAISNVVMDETEISEEVIVLKGSKTMYQPSSSSYIEPGYYVIKSDGTIIDNDPNVTITGTVGTTVGETYTLTYTLRNASNQITNVKTRDVIIAQSIYNFVYTGAPQTFTAPQNGLYQIELWGAQGGSNGGTGGYTSGNISLIKNNTFYVYVGGMGGNLTSSTTQGAAGYNGGGIGGIGAPPGNGAGPGGGGATDIRLLGGNWNDVSGLRSRIMVAGGGGGLGSGGLGQAGGYGGNVHTYGGAGGNGLNGAGGGGAGGYFGIGGMGGWSGGAGGTAYSTNDGPGAAGTFGIGGAGGGTATANRDGGGGGGGGYYGGGGGGSGGGGSHGTGGGGSQFISGYAGANAVNENGIHTNQPIHYSGFIFSGSYMVDGKSLMPNPSGGTEIGHTGNGYARIKLISIINETYQAPETSLASVEVLVVAGGGGGSGSAYGGGGGGAGGVIYSNSFPVKKGENSVVVGAGGIANYSGENSSFNLLTAFGGGPANTSQTASTRNGGSGGGGGHMSPSGLPSMATQTSNNGGIGYGNAGGATTYATPYPCGSGGGAGAAGTIGGSGGIGMQFNISGTNTYYAGGGGQTDNNGTTTSGGAGGGGSGVNNGNGGNGTTNTGGGGGGSRGGAGGTGGSGIVIIRYLGDQKATGGFVTTSGGYTIHTFTTTGTSTFNVW